MEVKVAVAEGGNSVAVAGRAVGKIWVGTATGCVAGSDGGEAGETVGVERAAAQPEADREIKSNRRKKAKG